jgi:hypothetical protein
MKKFLLSLVALVVTTAGFAQKQAATVEKVSKRVADYQQITAPVKNQVSLDGEFARVNRRSAADGVYYARPAGTYWVSGNGSSGTFEYLVVPPFTELKFINVSEDLTGKWTLGSSDLENYVEENNLIFEWDKIDKGYVGYCPVYTANEIAYQVSDYILTMDSAVQTLHPFDYVKIHRYYGFSGGESAFQTGADSFDFDGDGTAETFYPQFRQYFEKPAAPLTLHEVVLWAHSNSPKFTGDYLTLVFNKVERIEVNGKTYRTVGEKIGEMKCVEANMSDEPITGTTRYPGDLTFAYTTIDDFGTEEVIPLLIDDEFAITIEGTESPTLEYDCRFYFGDQGEHEEEWNTWATPTYILPFDADGNRIDMTNPNGLSYFGNGSSGKYCYNMAFHFYGEMDAIKVETDDDLNRQIAPVEGGDTESAPIEGQSYPAYVWTNYPFFIEDGDNYEDAGYYEFEGIPDWADVKIDPTYYEYESSDGSIRGLHMVWFTVEPLPEGVTGRSATVSISSILGAKSNEPIYIIQGDEGGSGVKAIKFDADGKFVGSTFNMSGQKVGADFKGLVIKNGRKFMNK